MSVRGRLWASQVEAVGKPSVHLILRQSRGVDPPVEIRRVEGAQRKWCRKTSVFISRETGMPGTFVEWTGKSVSFGMWHDT